MSSNAPRSTGASASSHGEGESSKRSARASVAPAAGADATTATKPQFGRRADKSANGDVSGATNNWFGGSGAGDEATAAMHGAQAAMSHVKDAVPDNLRTVGDEETNATASAALLARQQEEKARLAKAVAEAPTGYQAQMPRLTDLDIKNNWDKLLQTIHGEFDMTCLTACLARELDEDVAWNPEMLLVQLTSDMHDAAELKGEDANFVPVEDSEIGLMKGGEVSRKRKEKGAPDERPAVHKLNTLTGPTAAANAAAAPPSKQKATAAAAATPSAGSTDKSPRKKSVSSVKTSAKESVSPRDAGGAAGKTAAAGARRKSKDTSKS